MKQHHVRKLTLYGAIAFLSFMVGWTARASREQEIFFKGYEAASNHIASTIKTRMKELKPFYLSDIGIHFIPRGNSIAGMKYLSEEEADKIYAQKVDSKP